MAALPQQFSRWSSMLLRTRVGPGNFSWASSRLASSLTSVHDADGVRHITMTSPKTRNALSLEMLSELKEHVNQLSSSTRVVVLSGQGPAFSAGHNLKELTSAKGRDHHQCVFDSCTELMLGLQKLEVPVIAQVDGTAAAAGFQLVASCDIVIATPRSSFSTPGGNVGIFCSTPGIAVSRVLPRRLAAHLLLTGLPLSGEEALRVGLVSRLVEPDQLQHETAHIAAAIVRKSRSVIALGKKFFYQQLELPIDEAYRLGSRLMVDNIALKDGQEGIRGFIEKREPKWTHTDDKAHD
ncbi:enoyl-CoA hydratase domain-containing protein 3, mitochondrial-like isoform X2 [Amphibalanus amphitrite]|nr:enoyl-CoA hydratase domain-containing protein 3, mitochondrial-like isoform X2 [Amphibalanus amphitrite]XP_043207916.1 enoyl-CoA hydratase domain-containing protein 3, mitochondrial-like isoform X2 [Amphibalanus amphitrite]XP_043207917.1 enoyl-CoA hydratase domain-containing protein 3, mitochondrial-like isoform X2 [Amphibalanus amphitrite]